MRRREVIAGGLVVASLVIGLGSGAITGSLPGEAIPAPSPTPTSRILPSASPAPIALRTCSVEALSTDPRLGSMHARVMNANTG